jgi:thiol-disulfide isomerase/thioredoxin
MFRIFLVGLNFLSTLAIFGQDLNHSAKIEVLNFNQFEPLIHKNNDTLYLVNFWASWCGPCREEFPAFQQIAEKYSGMRFRLIMVSLDFPSQLETRLKPFLKTNSIKARLILLNDPHQNEWIDKVDPNWSGEIPFTLLYKNNERESYSHTFQYSQLDSIINLKIIHL